MTSDPKISVIIPTYNAKETISVAVQSILDQSFKDFECIIVDDASTDGTSSIIKAFAQKDSRIILITNKENLRICKTLNNGLAIARGKYIARMDADDWSYSDRLEKQFAYMESNPDIVISGGTMEICNEQLSVFSKRVYEQKDSYIRKKIFRYSPFCHPTTIYRTQCAQKIGGYTNYLADAEDYDFYFRLGLSGKFGNLPDTLLKYRVSNSSVSVKKARRQQLLTLYIRVKAVCEYGYSMSFFDAIYTFSQFIAVIVIPPTVTSRLFNFFRNS